MSSEKALIIVFILVVAVFMLIRFVFWPIFVGEEEQKNQEIQQEFNTFIEQVK